MKRHLKFFAAFYFSFLVLGVVSCDTCEGGSASTETVSVKELNWQVSKYKYDASVSVFDGLTVQKIGNDPVNFNEFAIVIDPVTKSEFAVNTFKSSSTNFMQAAYACDPVFPRRIVANTIQEINVFSKDNFDGENSAKADVSGNFDIIVSDVENSTASLKKYDLQMYVQSSPKMPRQMLLVLKNSPKTAKKYSFDVSFKQTGSEVTEFNHATQPVEITLK